MLTTRAAWSAALVVAMAVLVVCGCIASVLNGGVARLDDDERLISWKSVRVAEYVTLWDLAEMHSVDGLDVRDTVALISTRNALESTTIYAGQTILVPTDSRGGSLVTDSPSTDAEKVSTL